MRTHRTSFFATLRRPIFVHTALVLGGIVAALLTVELLLQVGALVVHATTRMAVTQWRGTSSIKLLTLGDSNTYGLYVGEAAAYPRVVESLWNSDPGRPRLEVINLGYPGTNSSQVRNRLPQLLSILHPDLVTIMVGCNDFWTAAEPVTAEASVGERLDFIAWRYSRVYRLVTMLREALHPVTFDIPRAVSGEPLVVARGDARVSWSLSERSAQAPPATAKQTHENLLAVAERARQAGVRVVFLTYPADLPVSPRYGDANRKLRAAAAAAGVSLIDLGAAITPRCQPPACEDLLWDHHPSVIGHRHAAEIIVSALAELLGSARRTAESN